MKHVMCACVELVWYTREESPFGRSTLMVPPWSPFRVPTGAERRALSGARLSCFPPTYPPHQLACMCCLSMDSNAMQEVPCFSRDWQSQYSSLETARQLRTSTTPLQMPHHRSGAHNLGTKMDLQDDHLHCEQQKEVVENACFVEQLRFPCLISLHFTPVPLELSSSACLACLLLGLRIVTMFQEPFLPLLRVDLRVQELPWR